MFCGRADAEPGHRDPVTRLKCLGGRTRTQPARTSPPSRSRPRRGISEAVADMIRIKSQAETIAASYQEGLIDRDDVFRLLGLLR